MTRRIAVLIAQAGCVAGAVFLADTAAFAQRQGSANTSQAEEAFPEALPPLKPLGTSQRPVSPGSAAQSSVGRAGERQTRGTIKGISPIGRVDSRVPSRVQARLRNRIDRYYDPQANAVSPFAVAADLVRRQGQAPRR